MLLLFETSNSINNGILFLSLKPIDSSYGGEREHTSLNQINPNWVVTTSTEFFAMQVMHAERTLKPCAILKKIDHYTLLNPSQFESPLNEKTFSHSFRCPQRTCGYVHHQTGLEGKRRRKILTKENNLERCSNFMQNLEHHRNKKTLTIPLMDEGLLWLTIKRHSSCLDNWHQIVRKIIPVSTTNTSSGHVTATWIPSHILV